VIFNEIWPAGLGFINFPVPKGKLGDLILNTYKVAGDRVTVETLDRLKELGFQTAFQAGISIGIDDMIIPENKKEIVHDARKKVDEVEFPYTRRASSPPASATTRSSTSGPAPPDRIAKSVFAKLENNDGKVEVNPVYHHDGFRRPW